jgi:hypothetical protein
VYESPVSTLVHINGNKLSPSEQQLTKHGVFDPQKLKSGGAHCGTNAVLIY